MPGGPKEEFRIALDEYEGKLYLSLRVWERSPNGQWWPVRGKGVTVRVKELVEAIPARQQAASILSEDRGQDEPAPRSNRR